MKKLLVMALGLGMALGTVSFAAQATDTTNPPKKEKKAKKAKKSSKSADKMQGSSTAK